MKYLRCHKRSWAWLAIVALLSHALALGAPTAGPSVDSVLGPLVICTANGAKAAQGDGTPGGSTSAEHCPACMPPVQLALAAGLTAALFIAFPTPTMRMLRPPTIGASSVAVHLVIGGIHSRGPPHAA
jgi:hypothetical protein